MDGPCSNATVKRDKSGLLVLWLGLGGILFWNKGLTPDEYEIDDQQSYTRATLPSPQAAERPRGMSAPGTTRIAQQLSNF